MPHFHNRITYRSIINISGNDIFPQTFKLNGNFRRELKLQVVSLLKLSPFNEKVLHKANIFVLPFTVLSPSLEF